MARRTNPPRVAEPVPYLSAGRYYTPERYVIGWPNGVIKVGSTSNGRRRWGMMLARGGIMIDQAYYVRAGQGVEAESWLHEQLAGIFPPAFNSKHEAEPILGNQGAGYLECYQVDPSEWHYVQQLARAAA